VVEVLSSELRGRARPLGAPFVEAALVAATGSIEAELQYRIESKPQGR
jgi:hypothetical protein